MTVFQNSLPLFSSPFLFPPPLSFSVSVSPPPSFSHPLRSNHINTQNAEGGNRFTSASHIQSSGTNPNCYKGTVTAQPPLLSLKTILGIHEIRYIKKKACCTGQVLCKGTKGGYTQAIAQGGTEGFFLFLNIFKSSETVLEIPISTNYIQQPELKFQATRQILSRRKYGDHWCQSLQEKGSFGK